MITYKLEMIDMYIDVIVLIVLLILVVMFFKRFSSFVLALGIIETFLRIVSFIKHNIPARDIANILNKYLPDNIFAIIDNYSRGIFNTILKWIFVILMCFFLFYITKIFIKKKKI